MTARALGMPRAQRVVPSSGSTAMSTWGGLPSPICSPLKSIGASSFSPSPITTTPSIATKSRTKRIASTAAPPAASLSPRPTKRAAASAAASVTRTSSRAMLRSGFACELLASIGPNPSPTGVRLTMTIGVKLTTDRVSAMDRWGLTLPLPATPLGGHEELVKKAEAVGYTDFWSGETAGPDGFTPLSISAAWTERARLGTGIVGVFQRGPALLAQEAAALSDASNGRFVLGIGSSSDRIVEGWNGIPFEKPLSRVRETLEFLRTALDGERTASGFKLEAAPAQRVPIVLAALRGKMLELAVERADGAFTNFLPLAGLPKVTAQLEGAPDGFELLCRFFR